MNINEIGKCSLVNRPYNIHHAMHNGCLHSASLKVDNINFNVTLFFSIYMGDVADYWALDGKTELMSLISTYFTWAWEGGCHCCLQFSKRKT